MQHTSITFDWQHKQHTEFSVRNTVDSPTSIDVVPSQKCLTLAIHNVPFASKQALYLQLLKTTDVMCFLSSYKCYKCRSSLR